MKKYIEFYDKENGYIRAVDELNKFIAENKHLKVSVIGYQVVRYEQFGADRTYILAGGGGMIEDLYIDKETDDINE